MDSKGRFEMGVAELVRHLQGLNLRDPYYARYAVQIVKQTLVWHGRERPPGGKSKALLLVIGKAFATACKTRGASDDSVSEFDRRCADETFELAAAGINKLLSAAGVWTDCYPKCVHAVTSADIPGPPVTGASIEECFGELQSDLPVAFHEADKQTRFLPLSFINVVIHMSNQNVARNIKQSLRRELMRACQAKNVKQYINKNITQ
jgi:hypothetical protein